jgi:hypothetical protein
VPRSGNEQSQGFYQQAVAKHGATIAQQRFLIAEFCARVISGEKIGGPARKAQVEEQGRSGTVHPLRFREFRFIHRFHTEIPASPRHDARRPEAVKKQEACLELAQSPRDNGTAIRVHQDFRKSED